MNTENNGARALVILFLVAVPVAGAAWLIYRLTERTIQAIDHRYGDGFWLTIAVALATILIFTLAGGALALVRRWSRHLRAKDGLFPILDTRRGLVNPNEAGAQTLAAIAGASRRVSAPMAARVIDAHYSNNAPAEPVEAQIAAPVVLSFPAKEPVYSSPLPRALALPVGIDGLGHPVSLPLRNLGNVLVAGLPGSGKSELLASMVAGLLRQDATGQRLKVAMVDTKLVSFGSFPDLAALWTRPALEIDDAADLTWGLLEEVRSRFQLLHAARARTLEEYEMRTGQQLPYLIGVYDELADMTTDPDRRRRENFTVAATEIGRKGRAAGVSLIMATQRPSTDVIPSSLRNLAGAAVAFRMAKADDSRLVIGDAGAESLPSTPGRCLVKHADVTQVQAYFAGLEGGHFDTFLDALPLGDVPQPRRNGIDQDPVAVDGWPVRDTAGIPLRTAPNPHAQPGIPVFDTAQQSGYTPDQIAHIRRLYADLGSLKAVQRHLYDGQEGGHWFYQIRTAVQGN